MSETFEFIKEYRNIYENVAYTEQLLESATSVLELGSYENQMRKTAETMINKLISEFNVQCDERTDLRNKIDLLYERGIIDRASKDNYHTMRMEGNTGSHAHDTMDTHSAQNYYKEKREKDENAFKRLFVECHAFVEVYMPKVNGGSNISASSTNSASIESTLSSASSYSANPQQANSESSVKYGSSQNTMLIDTPKKGANPLLVMVSLVIFVALLVIPIFASVFIGELIYGSRNLGTGTEMAITFAIVAFLYAIEVWGVIKLGVIKF